MFKYHSILATLLFLTVTSCSKPAYIRGTTIPDTNKNREIIRVVERYRHAMINKDVATLVSLIHPKYYQPKTNSQSSPYGYKKLLRFIKLRFKQLKSARLDIQYRKIHWKSADTVELEVYLDGSYQIDINNENTWRHKSDYMKIVLKKHKDNWLIISGL